jgi:hypothetical protein
VVLYRGQCGFTVADVLAVSWFLGELRTPWRQLLEALACQERAGALDLEADDGVLTEMSEEFRYERELLTVEEIERWLAARDLTEDDFNSYLVRRYWHAQPPEPVEAQEADYLEASPELRELLRAELLFSGKFDRLAQAASWRLAARPEGSNENAESVDEERARFFERTGLEEASLPAALKHLNRTADWFEECLQMEVCYRRVCDSLVTEEARARTLAVLRLPLTRINIQTLILRSKGAAQEAVLCLRENRLSPEELATECGTSWEGQELFLGDCEADTQRDLLSAAPGEVLAPRPCDDGFLIARIENKTEPDLRDDEIRGRIDRRLLESHFSEICSRNIRWVWGDWAR